MLDDTDTVLEDDTPFSAVQALASRLEGGIKTIAADIDREVKRGLELWPNTDRENEMQLVHVLAEYSRVLDECRKIREHFKFHNDHKANDELQRKPRANPQEGR